MVWHSGAWAVTSTAAAVPATIIPTAQFTFDYRNSAVSGTGFVSFQSDPDSTGYPGHCRFTLARPTNTWGVSVTPIGLAEQGGDGLVSTVRWVDRQRLDVTFFTPWHSGQTQNPPGLVSVIVF
jgi:hypothetical protein